MIEKKIKQVHFQITRNCNLRCPFCGQWGKKGYFADSSGSPMSIDDWKNIISQLVEYRETHGENITVTVWGGEPMVSQYFDELLVLLKEKNFNTEVITNGVLINEHFNVLSTCVDRLYVSIDGPEAVHDEIRGKGVYQRVTTALKALAHPNVTVMSVITQKLLSSLPEFMEGLNSLGIKDLYLQDMIALSKDEINEYKAWLKGDFDIDARDIDSWESSTGCNGKILDGIDTGKYNYTVTHKIHTDDCTIHCLSPFRHVHIAWNGEVLYCTDFYDFSAGNIRDDTLENIFLNEKSEKYRAGVVNNKCATCRHCSWRISR